MASNWNTKMAWEYHEATKHSYASIRANPHFLDWANQPVPFKIYPTLERVRLPGEVRPTGIAALSAIAESVPPDSVAVPDVAAGSTAGRGACLGAEIFLKLSEQNNTARPIFSPPLLR